MGCRGCFVCVCGFPLEAAVTQQDEGGDQQHGDSQQYSAADEHGDGAAEAAGVDGGVGETAVTAETAETAGVPACVDADRNAVLDQGGGVNRIR